jgi:hypothetical protein
MEHLRRNGYPEETMKALSDEAPRLVMPVPRLEQYLKALLALTDPPGPPWAIREIQAPTSSLLWFWRCQWRGIWEHHTSGW